MGHLGWTQYVFITCFVIFAVGLPLAWPSHDMLSAMAKLAGGAAIATCVWLGVVYLSVRRRR